MTRPASAPGETPGLRTGAEVAEMLGPLIAELSPRETALLTMSAPILTIAGLKPAGYVTDAADTYGLAEKLFGRFPDPQVTFFGTQEIGGQLIVHNFQALERITRTSKLPGIIPYDGASGLRGLIEYREAQKEAFEFMTSIGAYHPGTLAESLMQGLEAGYPDQAILDFEHARANIGRGFWEALRLMRLLSRFRPRLIGSVMTGHVRAGSDIDLHLFSDSIDAITDVLDDLVGRVDQGLGDLAFESRQADIQARCERVASLRQPQVHLGIDGPVGRQRNLLFPGDQLDRAEKASGPPGSKQLFGIGSATRSAR